MALKKNAGPASAAQGKFEDEDTGAQVATAEAPAAADPAKAAAQATTAIATAGASSSRALALGSKFTDVFKALENALPAMDFGTLTRLVGTNGGIEAKLNGGKTLDLGKSIDMTLISFRTQYTISPGDDSSEAKKHVAYSTDGITIDSNGKNVNEYLEHLRTVEGYEDADKKLYTYLTGIIERADDDQSLVGQVVEVSLSPGAVKDWNNYRFQRSAAIATGRASAEGSERISIRADKRSGNGNNWTSLVVGPASA